jgi:hypothetical protein
MPIRWARRATALSWVTRTRVIPVSRQRCSSRPMMSSRVSSSRLPVGSSASTTLGCLTRARAMATRCCWPPDSSPGRCRSRSPSPTVCSAPAARALRSSFPVPSGTRAASTFSSALSVGIRLNVWKMNPIEAARTRVGPAGWPAPRPVTASPDRRPGHRIQLPPGCCPRRRARSSRPAGQNPALRCPYQGGSWLRRASAGGRNSAEFPHHTQPGNQPRPVACLLGDTSENSRICRDLECLKP